jgi:Fe2+ or Zn2+ uptake regulation protein
MDRKHLLENLFDKKILKIIQLLLRNSEEEFYLQEISKKARVPISTVYRIVNLLTSLNILEQVKIKKLKLYRIADNEHVKFISSFIEEKVSAIKEFVDKAKNVEGVQYIILHGQEEKEKANLLIIGDISNQTILKSLIYDIKTKYKYTISMLTLEAAQFKQMTDMGLYPGKKKVLYQKQSL